MSFFKSTRQELIRWTQSVVTPLTHQLRMQQKLIKDHKNELLELNKSNSNIVGKVKGLNRLIGELEMEARNAEDIINALDSKKPGQKKSNVVRISTAHH